MGNILFGMIFVRPGKGNYGARDAFKRGADTFTEFAGGLA
ncbi:hypothetical protein LL13C17_45230 [Escherichia coli]